MPAWRLKHPCLGCGSGYGECIQGLSIGLMCCGNCDHPGRWAATPYSPEDLAEMCEDET